MFGLFALVSTDAQTTEQGSEVYKSLAYPVFPKSWPHYGVYGFRRAGNFLGAKVLVQTVSVRLFLRIRPTGRPSRKRLILSRLRGGSARVLGCEENVGVRWCDSTRRGIGVAGRQRRPSNGIFSGGIV